MDFVGHQTAGREGDHGLFVDAHDGGGAVGLQGHDRLDEAALPAYAFKALVHTLAVGQTLNLRFQINPAAVDGVGGADLQRHFQTGVGEVSNDDSGGAAAAAHGGDHHTDGARTDDQNGFPQTDIRPADGMGRNGQRLDQRAGLIA